jgi:magnesium-protoporphyrin O-methyltransferase
MSLLDIGGGIGAIQHELFQAGLAEAVNVEASTAYVDACRSEAERRGYAPRIRHRQGDFVEVAPEIPPADIVTLDRVICCYHDMPELVGLSLARTRKLYGLVYPRDTWWTRLLAAILFNFRFWLRRNPFRVFVHPTKDVEALVRKHGLERRFHWQGGGWQVAIFAHP